MNREIKFRAWWKNRLDEPEELVEYFEERPISDLNASHLIINQYTGLKDNNSTEIYEGDIVKTKKNIDGNYIEQIIKKYIVIFEGFSFQLKPLCTVSCNYTCSLCLSDNTIIEVVGNIYENPELLLEVNNA